MIGCVALWQIVDMRTSGRANDELHARLARDVAAWPVTPGATVIAWNADFPFERWVRPFRTAPLLRRQILHSTHLVATPLAEPFYAAWGSRDTLWALCHVPRTYLIDGRRGYIERHVPMLTTYMREHHAEDVTLTPAFDGEATSLLACRPR